MKRLYRSIVIVIIVISNLLGADILFAQEKLYYNEFSLKEVTLLNGQFKKAMDTNIQTLLQYDTDRLLEPFLKQAGLTPKGAAFINWDGLAGHIGGHYLTALAMNYASTGNEACKERLDYMLAELRKCQVANGNGYLGGVPDSKLLWADMKRGDFSRYKSAWVPWYNLHKTYAGLRDAWLYAGSDLAKQMFIELCDWGVDIISGLNYNQLQTMLDTEFGGMNEVYADACQLTGDKKYLDAAKRFTHYAIFNPLVSGSDQLDNLHANTQIPKIIGFARIAQIDPAASNYAKAAKYFWETVVNKRTLAFGGNSRSEHFPANAACEDYVTSREGPESCNTYNMLKLTEQLFEMEPNAKYIDYYERAIYNHIISTQHPEHGGYVYFTPARPRHYRVYSAVNKAMWCCVGSGMENHGKYGQMIYTHKGNDSLFINLFIPSKLNWESKSLDLEQNTGFPDEQSTTLTILKAPETVVSIFVRHPKWVDNADFEIMVNGEKVNTTSIPGTFEKLDRKWVQGDQIKVVVPLHFSFEHLPNVSEYLAIQYGPLTMGAKTGNQGLNGLVADDGRWSHIASGELLALNSAPVIEGNRDSILRYFEPVDGQSLKFTAPDLFPDQPNWQSIVFEPFSRIHDSRYMMYWMSISREAYKAVIDALAEEEQARLALDRRTIDGIATGEQQPDADHNMTGYETYNGVYNNEYYRDARNGGFFSYKMATGGRTDLSLMVRYWGNEGGYRTFDILIDNVLVATENISGKWRVNNFVNVEYSIPVNVLNNKETVTVMFKAKANNTAGGVYYLRLLKPDQSQSSNYFINKQKQYPILYKEGKIILNIPSFKKLSDYNLFSLSGQLISSGQFEQRNRETYLITESINRGVYLLLFSVDGETVCTKVALYN